MREQTPVVHAAALKPLADWFVKERDDLISATRVGIMMLRQASSPEDVLTAPHAAESDYDPLSGAPVGQRVGSTREDVAWDPLR